MDLIIPDWGIRCTASSKIRQDNKVFQSVRPASGEDEPATSREKLELTILGMTWISEDELAFGHE